MNLFSRIAIGTAAWGKTYNGAKVSEDDQKRILDYALSSGIDMVDTATAYSVDWTKWNSYFKIVLKISEKENPFDVVGSWEERPPYCLMAHNLSYYSRMLGEYHGWSRFFGASLYEPGSEANVYAGHIIQVPYSLYDRRFESAFNFDDRFHEIHVRSIFLRGKILAKTTPQECIKFCLCNPAIDRVIVGADSFGQFKDNVHFIHEWNRMEKHDIDLLDPRRWEAA